MSKQQVDFLPSQVWLSMPPLTGTVGRTEREVAAALIVRVCQRNGNTWAPVAAADVVVMLKADGEAGIEPMASIGRNPSLRPDVWGLVYAGFAEFTDPDSDFSPLQLTHKGLEALRGYVREV